MSEDSTWRIGGLSEDSRSEDSALRIGRLSHDSFRRFQNHFCCPALATEGREGTSELNRHPFDDVSGDSPLATVVEASCAGVGVAGEALDVFQRNPLGEQIGDRRDAEGMGRPREPTHMSKTDGNLTHPQFRDYAPVSEACVEAPIIKLDRQNWQMAAGIGDSVPSRS